MEITANNPKELLADFGSEVLALVQRGETDKLAKLTDDAHEELMFLIKEQTVERIVKAVNCHDDLVEALKEAINALTIKLDKPKYPEILDFKSRVEPMILQALAKAEGK